MTIEVTGCHDCPFCEYDGISEDMKCGRTNNVIPYDYYKVGHIPKSCPLKQETITIKLKENDTTGVCKEGE